MNKCVGCGLDFKSVHSFDQHRVFSTAKENWKDRRCLTETELREKGYEPDILGRWRKPMSEEEKKSLFGVLYGEK